MEFKQVKPLKGSELVLLDIKERISSGQLAGGDKLPSVVDLAANFGVGRSTVREALSALKAMGWIEIQQGGGTYVSRELPAETVPPSAGDMGHLFRHAESLIEILEVRKVLETGCASLAAIKRTPEDLLELERILLDMSAVLEDEKLGERADIRFHLQVARSAHNSMLLQMMESLAQKLQESMRESRQLWFYGERASAERLLQEHTDIYHAIAGGDEAGAHARMLEHLMKVESVIQKLS